MATTPQNLAIGQVSGSGKETIFAASDNYTGLGLVITNLSSSKSDISIWHRDGSADVLLAKRSLPGGAGKTWIVSEIMAVNISSGQSFKIQSDTSINYNYNLSGTLVG